MDRTYDVLVIRVQIQATPLGLLPHFRNCLVLICLVDDLGNDLGPLLNQTRIGRWEFSAMDRVSRGIFNQQRQEREDAANQEGYQD